MTDRPILFSGPMVRALLDGRKTQTRRVLSSDKPNSLFNGQWSDGYVLDPGNASWREQDVRFHVGDRLWVRESLVSASNDQGRRWYSYAADGKDVWPLTEWLKARDSIPSIHMPRWASRMTLAVTDVRVQRLQEIGEEDAIAEGCRPFFDHENPREHVGPNGTVHTMAPLRGPLDAFRNLWDSLNAERGFGWEANPWVCAIGFDVKRGNIDNLEASS